MLSYVFQTDMNRISSDVSYRSSSLSSITLNEQMSRCRYRMDYIYLIFFFGDVKKSPDNNCCIHKRSSRAGRG